MTIRASIYEIDDDRTHTNPLGLWAAIGDSVTSYVSGKYDKENCKKYELRLPSTGKASPRGKLIRYRAISASIRRHDRSSVTLMDVSVSNIFVDSENSKLFVRTADYPEHAHWIRDVSKIPLAEHVDMAKQFVADISSSGYKIQDANLESLTLPPAKLYNNVSEFTLPEGSILKCALHPIHAVETDISFAVVTPSIFFSESIASKLSDKVNQFYRSGTRLPPKVFGSKTLINSCVNLIVLSDTADLNKWPKFRNRLRAAERDGIRFKIIRSSSVNKAYPLVNIAYELCLLGGMIPWQPLKNQPAFCSIDAGHCTDKKRSRWVKVESDKFQAISDTQVKNTTLAEHIPSHLYESMWPSDIGAIFCRDGRLASERSYYSERGKKENHSIIECKKHPKSVIWREDNNTNIVRAGGQGDCVIDSHRDFLMQPTGQNMPDAKKPIRLTIDENQDKAIELAQSFFEHYGMPGLSLFNTSRLPGTLYFADLISKLTEDGWIKIIGHGLRIDDVIPD